MVFIMDLIYFIGDKSYMIIVILISIQRINNLVKVVIKIDVNFNQIHIRIMG